MNRVSAFALLSLAFSNTVRVDQHGKTTAEAQDSSVPAAFRDNVQRSK